MRFEKLPMRALSSGRSASTNCAAAFSTSLKLARMLPLRSSSMTAVIGWIVVGEQRQVLPLAVVVDRERVAREIGDQPAVRTGDRRIDGDRAIAGLECRLLARTSGPAPSRPRATAVSDERRRAGPSLPLTS